MINKNLLLSYTKQINSNAVLQIRRKYCPDNNYLKITVNKTNGFNLNIPTGFGNYEIPLKEIIDIVVISPNNVLPSKTYEFIEHFGNLKVQQNPENFLEKTYTVIDIMENAIIIAGVLADK